MAPILTPQTETRPTTAADERGLNFAYPREDALVQGSAEWEQRLWSLGKYSHAAPLSPSATSREVIYEDTAL